MSNRYSYKSKANIRDGEALILANNFKTFQPIFIESQLAKLVESIKIVGLAANYLSAHEDLDHFAEFISAGGTSENLFHDHN
jgi:hypothetical protein